ncbi:hypothetical protein [Vineibacter terrae]|uniref:hypothetical protein n=1 Tax=Vineibacter terrae TaxID=2586908 RepID=UPI002E32D203|nr:hypothetical protein [Vineibacter terrae]HEX2890385.1 hypothetical protein [Vineibacter terrae]
MTTDGEREHIAARYVASVWRRGLDLNPIDLSLGAMMVHGMAWFDRRNFTPEAAGLRPTFLRALAIAALLEGDKA